MRPSVELIEAGVGAARFSFMMAAIWSKPDSERAEPSQVREDLLHGMMKNGDLEHAHQLITEIADADGNFPPNIREAATARPQVFIELGELFARALIAGDTAGSDYYRQEAVGTASKDAVISAGLESHGAPTLAKFFRPHLAS